MFFCITGPPACGKTTALRGLENEDKIKEALKSHGNLAEKLGHIRVFDEDVDDYTNFRNQGVNLLGNMYQELAQAKKSGSNECAKHALRFQLFILAEMLANRNDAERDFESSLSFFNTDPRTMREVYLNELKEVLGDTDYLILCKLVEEVHDSFDEPSRIYLKVDPEVGFERLKKRGRPEELDMTFEKYKSIVDRFEKMSNYFDFVIDTTSMTPPEVMASVIEFALTAKSVYDLSSDGGSTSSASPTPLTPSDSASVSRPKFVRGVSIAGEPAEVLDGKSAPSTGVGSSKDLESVTEESPSSPETGSAPSDEEMSATAAGGEGVEE